MTLLATLKADVEALPSEVETLVEHIISDAYAVAKPILQAAITNEESNVVANAGNPAALMTTALAIGTAALPELETAGITALGTTILNWVSTLLSRHPAVVAAQAAVTAAVIPAT